MTLWRNKITWLTLLALLATPFLLPAKEYELEEILAQSEAPEGVVIEIVTGDDDGLSWALPIAQDYIRQIRQRFKDLPIAVVSHGREQFALTRDKQQQQKKVQQTTRSLIQDSKVAFHVCGTYAGWRGLTDEDFAEFVDVAAAGPAQINDYVSLGYYKLVISSSGEVFD